MNIPKYPKRIVLELTPRCNLSCPMCPRHHTEVGDGNMRWELWQKLIDELAETNTQTIILPFWRGESLLHPNFLEFIEYALNKSLKIHVSTNGHLVTGEYSAMLARCEFVTFSIHTSLGYARACEFLSFKKTGKPVTQVSFVENEITEKFLHQLIESPDLQGFDSVRVYEEHSTNGVFGRSNSLVKAQRTFCPKLLDTIVIAFDGTVSRCNHIWKTEKGINVSSMSICDAWESRHLQKIREGYPDSHCAQCDQWTGHTCGESWRLVNGKKEYKYFGTKDLKDD